MVFWGYRYPGNKLGIAFFYLDGNLMAVESLTLNGCI